MRRDLARAVALQAMPLDQGCDVLMIGHGAGTVRRASSADQATLGFGARLRDWPTGNQLIQGPALQLNSTGTACYGEWRETAQHIRGGQAYRFSVSYRPEHIEHELGGHA